MLKVWEEGGWVERAKRRKGVEGDSGGSWKGRC